MTLLFFIGGFRDQWIDPGATELPGYYEEEPYKRKNRRKIGTVEEFKKDKHLLKKEEDDLMFLLMYDFDNFND